jgi:hypothetical protein
MRATERAGLRWQNPALGDTMGRRKIDHDKKRLAVTVSIGPKLRAKIDSICERTQESRGQVLERLITKRGGS